MDSYLSRTFFGSKKTLPKATIKLPSPRNLGQNYTNLDNDGSDQEDNLLFGMETVDNSVFPLVPDSEFDGSNLATIPEQNSFGDPLGVLRLVVDTFSFC